MSTRMKQSVVRRPNLPLSEADDRNLADLKTSPFYRAALAELSVDEPAADSSEGVLLHAVFEIGMAAIRERAEQLGYLELAADPEYVEEARLRRQTRRQPRWADEP